MPPAHDPISLVRAASAALRAGDWAAVATMCDPVSVRTFARTFREQYRPQPFRELSAEDFIRMSPGMPREVAEYQAAQFREHADPAKRLGDELPGTSSIEELESLDPTELFVRWLEGRSPRRQLENASRDGHGPAMTEEQLATVAPFPFDIEPIGHVEVGRIAIVLYRYGEPDSGASDANRMEAWLGALPEDERELTRDLAPAAHPMTLACRRQPDGSWALVADYGMFGMQGTSIMSTAVDGDDDGGGDEGDGFSADPVRFIPG